MEKKLKEEMTGVSSSIEGEGSTRLMFQDEARFGLISDVRHCWCQAPFRPIVKAQVSQQYTYAYAAVSPVDGKMDSLILPQVNGDCMQIFIDEISQRYSQDKIVMVLDGAGWHKSKEIKLPSNLRFLPLPPYSPELNPVEHIWDEIREKHFCNRLFDGLDSLEANLETALNQLENDSARVMSITAWDWIVNTS